MSRASTRKVSSAPADWQIEFIERVGSLADASGLPPSHMQVFAWLVVCDPPHQSVEQMREALGLSVGALSMATTALISTGLVERIARPGERRLYYRFRPGGWERMLRARLEGAARMRVIADDALARAPEPPVRLSEMRDMYAWFEDNMAELMAEATTWSREG